MALMTALAPRNIETRGVGEVNTFSIKANGKAFKVLIDGLYSDKVLSVIRELWTNAYDSHVMAACPDTPFDCHLPTVFEPEFRVRDYGISMTHEGVMRLYTTVFESTKEATNEQVGKLGLGSKSPFAYTDTFTVTAWLDGEKRTYSAFIGADYVPQIAHMLTEPSTEPDGFEVSFPVKVSDVSLFQVAANKLVIGFKTHPNITGVSIPPLKLKEHVRGTDWVLYERTYGAAITCAYARQGCVLYPINPGALPGISSAEMALLNTPLVIDFPIGALDISASRESLSYDDTTINNIVSRLDSIIADVSKDFVAKLHAAPTLWDAWIVRKRIMDDVSVPSFVRDTLRTIIIKGTNFTDKYDHISYKNLVRSDLHIARLSRSDFTRSRIPLEKANVTAHGGFHLVPGEEVIYLHNPAKDKRGYVAERIRNHFNSQRYSPNAPSRALYVKADPESIGFKRFYVRLGRPPLSVFVDTDTLPDIPKEQRNRQPVKMKRCHSGGLQPCDVDFEAGGYYLPLLRDGLTGVPPMFKEANLSQICSFFNSLKEIGLVEDDAVLYGMPKSLSTNANRDNWINVWDIASAFFTAYYDASIIGKVGAAKRAQSPNFYDTRHAKVLRFVAEVTAGSYKYDVTGVFGALSVHINDLKTLSNVTPEQVIVERHIGMTTLTSDAPDLYALKRGVVSKVEAFYSAYPMFNIFATSGAAWEPLVNLDDKNNIGIAMDYISAIDTAASV